MLIIFTPWLTTGFGRPPLPVTCAPWVPIMSGTFGPVMSASRRPTRAPSRARLTARFTATVDLPTPPLPDATAIVFFTPGMRSAAGPPKLRFTLLAQSTRTRSAPSGGERLDDVVLDRRFQRAGGGGQLDREIDHAPIDRHVLHHPERDEVAPDLGILDPAERGEDVVVSQLGGHGACSGTSVRGPMRLRERSRGRHVASGTEADRSRATARGSGQTLEQRRLRRAGRRDRAGREPVVLGRQPGLARRRIPVVERARPTRSARRGG